MKRKGQSLLEYAILLAVVLSAFSAMRIYVERAAQATSRLIEKKAFSESEYANTAASWIEGFDIWAAASYLF